MAAARRPWLPVILLTLPLGALQPPANSDLSNSLPSILSEGTYEKKLYAVAIHDSGLAIFGNRRLLHAAGVRLATVDRPWTTFYFTLGNEAADGV